MYNGNQIENYVSILCLFEETHKKIRRIRKSYGCEGDRKKTRTQMCLCRTKAVVDENKKKLNEKNIASAIHYIHIYLFVYSLLLL